MNKHWTYFFHKLRDWYHPSRRTLPWKGVKDPYLVWVSEIFLQQTQADRVVEFYIRFTARFPTVQSLARANFEKALPYFRGLGYYQRLRNMLVTAKIVAHDHTGKFPDTVEELRQLPGVGEYTARAIASFAFGKKAIAPDTNVSRVIMRYFGKNRKWFKKILPELDRHYPVNFNLNQALMDLGAMVCLAKKPKCQECPLAKRCKYASVISTDLSLVMEVEERRNLALRELRDPSTAPLSRTHSASLGMTKRARDNRRAIPHHYQKVVVGVLIQDKRVLVSRRKPEQTYPGLLEFPGGKVEAGEDLRRAMQREFREELGVEVSVRPAFRKIVQHGKKQVLIFHRCRILLGKPRSLEGQEVRWMKQRALQSREFIPANKGIIWELQKSRL